MSRDRDVDATRAILLRRPTDAGQRGVNITVIEGPDAGLTANLEQRTALVGRAENADVRLADPTVSAFHVELAACDTGVRVYDLNSRNGTVHAGARIERAVVPRGATLQLGSTALVVTPGPVLEAPAAALNSFGELRGRSAASMELFSTLSRLARTELSVLIEGGTGTGKELAARAVHQTSARSGGPFIVLDCTAIPATLAESLLFGHERGAFTGAGDRQVGVFEAANGGTVFLDEIGELPLELQPKLLRVLERREIVRLGGHATQPVNIRVLCATWRDLRTMINEGRFREDLYYRVAQARVGVPPLRERPDDVPVLVEHFLSRLPPGAQGARAVSHEAMTELMRRDYPGNVRELKSVVERAALMSTGTEITPVDLAYEHRLSAERDRGRAAEEASRRQLRPSEPVALGPFKEAKRTLIDEFEKDYLRRLLAGAGGNLSRAAAVASVDRNYLRDLCRKHGLRDDEG